MLWRIVVLVLTGVLTLFTALGRFEDGRTGFLLWAPLVTSLLSFAALFFDVAGQIDYCQTGSLLAA